MKKNDLITPEGTRDLLFEECAARRAIEERLRKIFEGHGYSEVVTPGVEFYDVFSLKTRYFSQESMYKLSDFKGRLMVMRPDSTLPIARLVSTRLRSEPLPLKLFYNQTIFRINPKDHGRDDEITQSGIEIIGGDRERGDFEALAMAVEALSACATEDFRLEIGDSALFKEFIAETGADEEKSEDIRQAIETKNYPLLKALLKEYSSTPASEALNALPSLFGGKNALESAYAVAAVNNRSREILDGLNRAFDFLCTLIGERHITVDLGIVNKANYYTGIVFRGYISEYGMAVLSGGRYDSLTGDFGELHPATGFAVNINATAGALLKNNRKPLMKPADVIVFCEKNRVPDCIAYCRDLTDKGLTVDNSLLPTYEETLNYARQRKIGRMDYIDEDGKISTIRIDDER